MKKYLLFFSSLFLSYNINAQQNLIDTFVLGDCVEANWVTSSGQVGLGGGYGVSGLVLSTGNLSNIGNPGSDQIGSPAFGGSGQAEFEGSYMIFTFTPVGNTISFDYVFASEEYPEYSCSVFNDVFGFYISGPNPAGGNYNDTNIAFLPNGNQVTINNVNNDGCGDPTYFVDVSGASSNVAGFDGHTTVLTATADVVPCEIYTMTLAVSDVVDGILDSAVFLQENSFDAGAAVDATPYVDGTPTANVVEGCGNAYIEFAFEGGDPGYTEPVEVIYEILTDTPNAATPGDDYVPITQTIIINPGQTSVQIPVTIIDDGPGDFGETIDIVIYNGQCVCSEPPEAITFFILESDLGINPPGDADLCGSASYSAFANATGGQGPYTFTFTDDQGNVVCSETTPASISFCSVSPTETTTYSVSVTDVCGTEETADFTVSLTNSGETVSIVDPGPVCPSTPAFQLSATPAGGNWSGPGVQPNGLFDPFVASLTGSGPYTINYDTVDGCGQPINGSIQIVVNEPTISGTPNNANCGNTDGSITGVTVSNAATPITYTWTDAGGATVGSNANLNNVAPGTYTLDISDANGCTAMETFTVGDNPGLTLSGGSPTDPSCGGTDGSITGVNVSGGTPAFTYSWTDGSGANVGSNIDLNNVPAGSYTLTVSDANSCEDMITISLNEADGPTVSGGTPTNAACGQATGSISGVTVTGGTAPITYNWTDGSGTSVGSNINLNNVMMGTYTLTVTDANGCEETLSITVGEDPPPTISGGTPTNAACGQATGSISGVTVTGGTAPITYNWTDGSGASVGSNINLNNVMMGTYTLTVTDANNCEATLPIIVGEDPPPTISGGTPNNAACGQATGSISGITVTGGTAPITYNWTDGSGASVGSNINLNNVMMGTYTLTVTDGNNCTATTTINIGEDPPPTVSGGSPTDATCGDTNGSITGVVVSGGTPPITYNWVDGNGISVGSSLDLNNVGLGSYTLTVTDGNNCTAMTTLSVNEAAAQQVTGGTPSNASCGNANGSITGVTVTGGTPSYTYAWTDGNGINVGSGIDLLNVVMGTYTLTVTDANNCEESITLTINEDPPPTIAGGTPNNAACGQANGSITGATANGGTPTYTYNWTDNNGLSVGSTSDLTNVVTGTYTLTVTDANNCEATQTFTINEDAAPTISGGNPMDASCGLANGSITGVIVTGGFGAINYAWTDGNGVNLGNSTDLNSLLPGTYNLTVTDANGCSDNTSFSISDLPGPVLSGGTPSDATCGIPDGSITGVSVSGGTQPITFNWTDGNGISVGSGIDLVNVASGSYTITATDANNCETILTLSIGDAQGPELSGGLPTSSTCGNSNGSITGIIVTGGTGAISYTWTNAGGATVGSSPDLLNVMAGTYTLSVSDGNNCSDNLTFTISDLPPPVIGGGNPTNASCGNPTGSITGIIISSGTPTYTYNWTDQNGLSIGSNPDLTNLLPGSYTLTVTDANNCEATASFSVSDTPGPVLSGGSPLNETCITNDGGISGVTVSGGAQPLTFTWTNDLGQNVGSTLDLIGVSSGSYTISVSDANGCTDDLPPFTISLQGDLIVSGGLPQNATCGDFNGSISGVLVSGGTGSYNYDWTNDLGLSVGSTLDVSGLDAGTYTLNVTDAISGCTGMISFTLQNQPPPTLSGGTPFDATCNLDNGGVSGVIVSGGTGGLTFNWTNSLGVSVGATPDLANVAADTYTLTVTDGNGCNDVLTFTVNNGNVPTISGGLPSAATCGLPNGSVTGVIAVGDGNLTYNWTDGLGLPIASSLDLFNAPGGTYTLTVTDGSGCSVSQPFDIPDNPGPILSGGFPNSSSCGQSDGNVSNVTVQSGTGTLSYTWTDDLGFEIENGQVFTGSVNLQNVSAGTYTLTVTDANNCEASLPFTVSDASGPQITTGVVNAATCGQNNGSVIGTFATGGSGALSYSWVNGASIEVGTTSDLFNVPPDTYVLTVTDAVGCSASTVINVLGQTPPNISGGLESPPVCGELNGSITNVIITDGSVPFTYSWTDQFGFEISTSQDLFNVGDGIYTLVVTDVFGCPAQATYNLSGELAPEISGGETEPSTCGFDNGAITGILPNGSTDTWSILWTDINGNFVGTTLELFAIPAGTYTLNVTDINGCSDELVFTIDEIAPPTIGVGTINDASCSLENGSILQVAVTGTGLNYQWENDLGQNLGANPDLFDIPAGDYILTLTDENGCTTSEVFTINDQPSPQIDGGSVIPSSCGSNDGSISNINVTGGTGFLNYTWYNDNSEVVGNNVFLFDIPSGSYELVVEDINGCQASEIYTVSDALGPIIEDGTTNPASCGQANGSINGVNVSGGSGTLTITWTDEGGNVVGSSNSLPNVSTGSYVITVNDENGCTASDVYVVDEIEGPQIITADSNPAACGQNNGSLTNVQVNGGTGDYSYSWTDSNGQNVANNSDLTDVVSGTYTLTVTDENNCSDDLEFTIDEENGPTIANGTINDASCGNSNGSIVNIDTDGNAPLTYEWTNSAGNFVVDTENLTNQPTGDYTLTVTDGNGCTVSQPFTINELAAPEILSAEPQPSSCGNADGSIINVTTQNGTGTITYLWLDENGGVVGNNTDLTGVSSGSYELQIEDENGCLDNETFAVSDAAGPQITEGNTNDPTCGQNNGSITGTTASGGSGNLSYTWTDENGNVIGVNANISDIGAGDYVLTVNDEANCQATISYTLNTSTVPEITGGNITAPTCGETNGSVTQIVVSGGDGNVSYSWTDSNGNNVGNTLDLNDVGGGDYTLTVTDESSCTDSEIFTVPSSSQFTISGGDITEPTCGVDNGSVSNVVITPTLTDGSYVWEDANGTVVGDQIDLSGIGSGTYTLIVTDADGCSDQVSFNVNSSSAPQISGGTESNAFCGLNNGSITGISATGGAGSLAYEWTNSNGDVVGNALDLTNVGADIYTLTVTDEDNCPANISFTINDDGDVSLIGGNVTNETCTQSNGSITGVTANGTDPLTYSWTNDATGQNVGNTIDLLNVGAGDYTLTLTDANNCTTSLPFTISDNPAPQISGGDVTFSSCGANNGSITNVVITGGIEPINIEWTDENGVSLGTSNDLTNIGVGVYTITITDANGCTNSANYSVSENGAPTITLVSVQDADCSLNNGAIDVTVSGGVEPYDITWNTNPTQTSEDLNNLPAGNYTINVEDASGCSAVLDVEVPGFIAPPVPSCGENSPTSVTFNWTAVTNAQGYILNINGVLDTVAASVLTHEVTGLTEGDAVSISIATLGETACGASDFVDITCSTISEDCPDIELAINGLSPTYCLSDAPVTVNFSPSDAILSGNGISGNIFDPSVAGVGTHTISLNYEVELQFQTCPYNTTFDVTVYPDPTADFTLSETFTCVDDNVRLEFAGVSTPNDQITWDFGADAKPQTATGVGPHDVIWTSSGIKEVTLTIISENCQDEIVQDVTVSQISVQTIDNTSIATGESVVLETDISTLGNDISINWTDTQGIEDYCEGCEDPTVAPDDQTTYFVTVEDEFGCIDSTLVTLTVETDPIVEIPTAFSPNGDGVNDFYRPVVIIGVANLEFTVFDRWGNQVYYTNELNPVGWDGTYGGEPAELEVYVWYCSYTDFQGGTGFLKGNVTLVR